MSSMPKTSAMNAQPQVADRPILILEKQLVDTLELQWRVKRVRIQLKGEATTKALVLFNGIAGELDVFVDMIRKVGIRKQRRARKYLRIRREVEMREGNKFIAVYPSNSYSVSYSINFPHPLIGKETFEVELANGSYLKHIAAARTFGSRQDEQAMRNMGLIRGASSENCIVLTREGIENGPLRFRDEFVRHKILDLVGDLALFGKQVLGRVVADRAGHAMHTALVSRILRDKTLWEEVALPQEENEPAHSQSARATAGSSV